MPSILDYLGGTLVHIDDVVFGEVVLKLKTRNIHPLAAGLIRNLSSKMKDCLGKIIFRLTWIHGEVEHVGVFRYIEQEFVEVIFVVQVSTWSPSVDVPQRRVDQDHVNCPPSLSLKSFKPTPFYVYIFNKPGKKEKDVIWILTFLVRIT